MKAKRLMDKAVEERLVNFILEQASKNNLTISNIRRIADKAISYLEENAVLGEKVKKENSAEGKDWDSLVADKANSFMLADGMTGIACPRKEPLEDKIKAFADALTRYNQEKKRCAYN